MIFKPSPIWILLTENFPGLVSGKSGSKTKGSPGTGNPDENSNSQLVPSTQIGRNVERNIIFVSSYSTKEVIF